MTTLAQLQSITESLPRVQLDPWKVLDERISYLSSLAQRELRYGAMKRQQAMDLIWQTVRIRTNRHFIDLRSQFSADAAEAQVHLSE